MDRVSGLVVFFLGVCILWQGRHLSVGSLRGPGPGFFPTLLATILMILSFFLILPRGKKEVEDQSFFSGSLKRVLMIFVALLVYFFLLEYLGFVIVSLLFMAFSFIVVASYRWHTALLWAFVSIGLAYVLFDVLLKSNLPKGVFGF